MSDKIKKPTVLALGYFDSVHKGHRMVIGKARRYADEHGATLTVFTFGGNLRAMLNGNDDKAVYSAKEREVLLKQVGADEIYFAPVDFNFLSIGKLAFLNMINRKFNIICYVSGEDYRFGKFGKGTIEDIKRYSSEKGQDYIVVDTECYQERRISTTAIKRLLSLGSIDKANNLLGIPYFVTGVVFEDRKVGQHIGFPTVNIKIEKDKYRLRDAVYVGHSYIDGKKYKAIINYGARPTFCLDDKLIEAHIVDYDGNLYGQEITIHFDKYLREIQKFTSVDSLKKQLQQDLEIVKGGKYD